MQGAKLENKTVAHANPMHSKEIELVYKSNSYLSHSSCYTDITQILCRWRLQKGAALAKASACPRAYTGANQKGTVAEQQ